MSAVTTDAPVVLTPVNPSSLGAPTVPQVNLLPPEIRSKRALGRVKVRLAVMLLVVLLVAALGFVYAAFTERDAATELATAQDEAAALVTRQEQFAEVPQVKGAINRTQEARAYGMSTEVMWRDFLFAIQAVTPQGVSFKSLVIDLPQPGMVTGTVANPLAQESIGTVTFTGRSTTLPNVAAWLDALDSVPGFSDPTFSTATLTDQNGASVYDVTSTVQVDRSVFANRFSLTPETTTEEQG